MTDMMDMSDPDVQAMLEADKQEALNRIRAAKTATKTINGGTYGDLITRLTEEGFEADWDCLGGDWWGVCIVDDVSVVIITGHDGGHQAKRDHLWENAGMGFYHENGWVADISEVPTDWDEFVSLIRAWFTEGSIDGKSHKDGE